MIILSQDYSVWWSMAWLLMQQTYVWLLLDEVEERTKTALWRKKNKNTKQLNLNIASSSFVGKCGCCMDC